MSDGKIRKKDLVSDNAIKVYSKIKKEAVSTLKAIAKELKALALAQSKLGNTNKDNNNIQKKVNVKLTEAQKITKKLASAKEKLRLVTSKQNKELQKTNAQIRAYNSATKNATSGTLKLGASIRQAFSRFIGFTLISTAIFGLYRILKDIATRVVEFDKTMTNLSAILKVNRAELDDLEKKIKDVAGASIKTSTEVAKLAETLVVLGKTKEEIIQLLKPINDLSIGLEATSQETGELLIMTMNAFRASSREASRYADIIAKMRTTTALDFQKMRDSLAFLAPVAKIAGISFEKTAAILGVLVDNGIKASKAGRLTASSFLRLAKQGLSLEQALDKVNEAQNEGVKETELLSLATELFGVNSGAVGLILANNRKEVDNLTKSYEKSKGTLKELTDVQLKSLSAKLTLLDSIWEKIIINVENGNGVLARFFKLLISFPIGNLTRWDNLNTILESQEDRVTKLVGLWSTFNFWTNKHAIGIVDRINKENEYSSTLQAAVTVLREYNLEGDKQLDLIKITALLRGMSIEQLNDFIIAMSKGATVIEGSNDLIERTVGWYRAEIQSLNKLIELESNRGDIVPIQKEINKLQKELNALLGIEAKIKGKRNKVDKINTEMALFGSIKYLREQIILNTRLRDLAQDQTTRDKLKQENDALKLMIKNLQGIVDISQKLADTRGASFNVESDLSGLDIAIAEVNKFTNEHGEQIDQAIDTTNRFFDNRIERLFQDRDENDEYYGNLIDASKGNQEEQDRLEEERKRKDDELRKKQNEVAKKQAIFNKGLAVAEIAFQTAIAFQKAVAASPLTGGLPWSAIVIALGAAQAASIIAQPVPKFKDGKDVNNFYEGLALVNDGGKTEYREDKLGNISAFKGTNVLTHVSKDDIIHKDFDSLIDSKGYNMGDIYKASILTSLASEKQLNISKIENVLDSNLKGLKDDLKKGIRDGFSKVQMHNHTTIDMDWAKYKNDIL